MQVCKALGLLEKEYFGLCYQDKGGESLWVNLRNPLNEQLPQGNNIVVEMRVKYYISPHKILQPVTRLERRWHVMQLANTVSVITEM